MTGGTVNTDVMGGWSYYGDTSYARVYFSGGTAPHVYGGTANKGNASHNRVEISGGKITNLGVFGGQSGNGTIAAGGDASYNEVSISGNVTMSSPCNVYGGHTSTGGDATYNTVILGTTSETCLNVWGGYSTGGDRDVRTGNTLKVQGENLEVRGVRNFDVIEFTLPGGFRKGTDGDTALTMSTDNTVNLEKVSTINIDASALTSPLNVGDKIKLISKVSNFDSANTTIKDAPGYEFELSTENISRKDALVATVKTVLHTITVDSTIVNGSVTCNDGDSTVENDGTVSCTASPETGYELETLTIDDGVTTPATVCTTSPCTLDSAKGNVKVTATFKSISGGGTTYPISIGSGFTGGDVQCNGGEDRVDENGTVKCTATADEGYELTELKIEDSRATPATCNTSPSCTAELTGVTSDVDVSATFALKKYTVSVKASPDDAPKITCTPGTEVEHGDTVTCSYTPDANWTPNLTGLTLPSGCSLEGTTAVKCTGVKAPINVTIPFDKVDSGSSTGGGSTGGGSTGGSTGGGSTGGGSTGGGSTGGGSTGDSGGSGGSGGSSGSGAGTGGSGTGGSGTGGSGTGGSGTGGSDDAGNGDNGDTGNGADTGNDAGNGGGDSSSPTMGELGLLLSGIALAGAAAPALRRRERKQRKQA